MNDRPEKVRDLFDRALNEPPAARSKFLDALCAADPLIGPEVRELVAAFQQADGDATFMVAERQPPAPGLPDTFPGYKLLHEIHRGGQGVVYRAVQESTKRDVAIKVLLDRALIDRGALRRFEREIEMVAQLQHPNIVTVFDSGVTSAGRQFCVMDYIRGVPLDVFVRDQSLDLPQTLSLMLSVCEAVQYAHQKGVIHRDLKPSNILVESRATDSRRGDDGPESPPGIAKVLDFGLAKTTAGPGDVALTHTQGIIGTLPYLSPEQARGNTGAIDTRTDIYALGVVLYELMTGEYPYDVTGPLPDVLANIQHATPRPITSASKLEQHQRSRRNKWTESIVASDMRTIVNCALSKEPARRYQSAAELAADIRRALRNQPINARPPSAAYQLRKMVRRRPGLVWGTAATLLAVCAGLIGTAWFAIEAGRQRDAANHRLSQVQDLAKSLVFDIHSKIVRLPGSTPARRYIVEQALRYQEELAQTNPTDVQTLYDLAMGYLTIGGIQGGPDEANLGDVAGSIESFQRAAQIAEKLLAQQPQLPALRLLGARAADRLCAAELVRNNLDGVEPLARQALDLLGPILDSEPIRKDTHRVMRGIRCSLGDLHRQRGEYERALQEYQAALEAGKAINDNEQQALVYSRIARLHILNGQFEEALRQCESALALCERLAAEKPTDAARLMMVASAHMSVGDAQRELKRWDDAARSFSKAHQMYEEMASSDPADADVRRRTMLTAQRLSDTYRELGLSEECLRVSEAAAGHARALAQMQPNSAKAQRDLLVSLEKLGNAADALGQCDKALALYGETLVAREQAAHAAPDDAQAQRDFAVTLYKLGCAALNGAGQTESTPARRTELCMTATAYLDRCRATLIDMKRKAQLSPADAHVLGLIAERREAAEQILREIADAPR